MSKKVTLREFIEENYRLFTTIGVAGGLTAVFTRLENAEYLAFLSFIMLILLDWELWVAFPKSEEASITLTVFEWLLQIFLFAVGGYICISYTNYVLALLPVIIFSVLGGVFIILNKKFKLYEYVRKIAPENKRYSSIIRGSVAMVAIAVVFYLAVVLTNYITNLIKTL